MTEDNAWTDQMRRELGRVTSVKVGPEDHGIMTFWIMLDFGCKGQGFGGYSLDTWGESVKRRIGSAVGMDLLCELYRFFGVDDLGAAVGQAVYALRNKEWGTIHAIQRIEPDGGAIYCPRRIVDAWNCGAVGGSSAGKVTP